MGHAWERVRRHGRISEAPRVGLDTITVELTIKTLSSHLITPKFNFPTHSLRTPSSSSVEPYLRGGHVPLSERRGPYLCLSTFGHYVYGRMGHSFCTPLSTAFAPNSAPTPVRPGAGI
eukprot:1107777-Prorocentrum_minimum.AAC.1